ncbi:VWA domain-containing protein [Candidatus Woesearchaeota archaeon]|nr:VWA domain-containing protein [Candidatus Woesearchaeota archaeon]
MQFINYIPYANNLQYQIVLLIIPFLILLTLIIISKNFLKYHRSSFTLKLLVFILRSLTFTLILIAIASPFTQKEKVVEGEPTLKILVDNTSSFELFDATIADTLKDKLKDQIDVELIRIGSKDISNLGDSILNNVKSDESVLLISDGSNNQGADLDDVALFASRSNITINTIKLEPIKDDVGVEITGPSKTTADVDNRFLIKLNKVGKKLIGSLKVSVDGNIILETDLSKETYDIVNKFNQGYHEIKAEIFIEDHFKQNNVFYKTVKVVPKPKIAFLSFDESPLKTLLKDLYEIEDINDFIDLDKYTALIVNDVSFSQLNNIDKLSNFVSSGNGLVVVGGKHSFDYGEYKDSIFENILPVFVARGGKKEGDVNIVILLDISGSTSAYVGEFQTLDVNKALALEAINDLKFDNKLGIIAFNAAGYVVEDISYIHEKKENLEDKITRLVYGGGTRIDHGIEKALDMLKKTKGSKNIILISDGKTKDIPASYETAQEAVRQGVVIYTVGVGPVTNEEVMTTIADITSGIYFKITERDKLKLLFGENNPTKDQNKFSVVILNTNHFITQDLAPEASVYGFNQVVPKSTAQLLVTTDLGDPLLTVWRYGLGRVAALSTDDGRLYAGQLLNEKNSKLLTRTLNYAIGDPERKNEKFIDISDSRVNEETIILVRSPEQPVSKDVAFYKTDKNEYTGSKRIDKTGFHSILTATFAVNYESEYANLGYNPQLDAAVKTTNGEFFNAKDIPGIIKAIKSQSKRVENRKVYFRWPFLVLALLLFLLDILVRRIFERKQTAI